MTTRTNVHARVQRLTLACGDTGLSARYNPELGWFEVYHAGLVFGGRFSVVAAFIEGYKAAAGFW